MALLRPGSLNGKAAHPMAKIKSNPRFQSPTQYSRDLMSVLHPFKEKHLWVKKATGLGVTEFMLRFMAWLCVRDDRCKGSQMVIVTGPNQELAIKLIKRMKGLFADKLGVVFDNKETVLELNGCSIEAYPSNHIDAFRYLLIQSSYSLTKVTLCPSFNRKRYVQ